MAGGARPAAPRSRPARQRSQGPTARGPEKEQLPRGAPKGVAPGQGAPAGVGRASRRLCSCSPTAPPAAAPSQLRAGGQLASRPSAKFCRPWSRLSRVAPAAGAVA